MSGFKKGTGSLDLSGESEQDEPSDDQPQSSDQDMGSSHEQDMSSNSSTTSTGTEIDMEDLPYLVERQMRGAAVNSDRTKQLLLEVRESVKQNEEAFLSELQTRVDGPVYKGDAREAAMIVAQENPELVAEKLREWGIEYLDK